MLFRSIDMMVGGSCIGSPARINFCALRMGIQHTCYEKSVILDTGHEYCHTASTACVASSMMTTSKSCDRTCLPPAEWQVASTTWDSLITLSTTPLSRWRYLVNHKYSAIAWQ